ncbi:MAG TPA: radical SAM protein [Thermoplasmata archaeon]|nr:radical SAM protein [Thermoplasmata archaeon]
MAVATALPPGERFLVSEIYPTIQGESSLVGYPTVFVRLYSCNLRCAWCDSMHAVEGTAYEEQSVIEVVRRVVELAASGISHVCWTGGEPVLQWRAMASAIRKMPEHLVHSVETDGEVPLAPLSGAVPERRADGRLRYIMDVKCPGSKMRANVAFENLPHLQREDEVKFVILDRTDYEFARDVMRSRTIPAGTILFSPAAPAHAVKEGLDPATLAAWILKDGLDVRLQIQVHKVLWPGVDRGI